MKFRALLNILIAYTLLFPAGVTNLGADTISHPISVAVPTGMNGEMDSKPVSVAVPTGVNGEMDSKPVSVAIPEGMYGSMSTKPVSVSYAVTAADGTYMGRPATVAFKSENQGDSDLVGLWHMDGDWGDSSGNNLHGTPINGPVFSTEKKLGLNSGSFDGTDDYVVASNGYTSLAKNTFTIEFWASPTGSRSSTAESSSGASGTSGQRYAVYPAWFNNSTDAGIGISVGNNGVSVFEHAASYLPSLLVYNAILSGWNHVAVVYENKQARLYLNGLLVRTGLVSQRTNVYASTTFSSDNSYGRYQGLLDEVAIYKRALTAEEIAFHANAVPGDPAAPPSPVLNSVPSVVGTSTISLSGTKIIDTSIWVNNKKIAPLDNAEAWQGTYGALQPGRNLLNVVAVDATSKQSPAVTASVIYDNAAPVIESSYPANNSDTAKPVSSITINLKDTYSAIDLDQSMAGATVKNSAGVPVSGTWSKSGTRTIIFTPSALPLVSDSYLVTIYPTDAVGNKGQQQIAFTNHDISAPVTTLTVKEAKGKDGWYYSSVTITLSASDGSEGSGITKTEYSFDAASWQLYSSPFILEKDGVNTVYYRSTDTSGNAETTRSSEIKVNKTGLVGLWHMDNDNWKDSSIVGNDATLSTNTTFSSNAKIGTYAGSFNGSNSSVSIPDAPTLHPDRNITILGWIYVNAFDKTWQNIFWKGNSPDCTTNCENREYTLWLNSNGSLHLASTPEDRIGVGQLTLNTPTGIIKTAATAPANNGWFHFAAVLSSDQNTMKIYVNGVEQASGAYSSTNIRDTSGPLYLGSSPTWNSTFNGLIDEISIYRRVMSPTEIQENYRSYSIQMPTVEPVQTPTTTATIALTGTKPANTALVVNGTTVVPLDDQTTWSGIYTLQPGMNNLNITAMDADGFHSQAVLISVALDLAAPTVTSTDPVNNGLFNTSVGSITFNLNEPFSAIDLAATLTGASVTKTSGADPSGSWTSTGGGSNASITFTPAFSLSEGTYTATINPTDTLANRSAHSITFTVDATPPQPPTIDPILVPSRTTTKTITGTRSLDSTKVIVGCAGASVGVVSYPTSLTWSVTVSGLHEGSNTVTAYALDQASNPSSSTEMTFTVDTLAPAPPAVNQPATPTKQGSITLAGTKEAGSYLYVNNVKTQAAYADTSWSYGVNLASEGNNAFVVFVQDEAGNPSQSVTVNVVRDTTGPRISTTTPQVNGFVNQLGSIDILLIDDNSGVDLQESIKNNEVKTTNTVINGSWTSQAGGHIVFTPASGTVLTEGSYTVTIKAADVLANPITLSFSFTLDTGLPAVQSLTMNPASPHKAENVTFTVLFSEDMLNSVQPAVSFSRCLLCDTYTLTNGNWTSLRTWTGSYTFTSNNGDGTYSVKITGAKDKAGNAMTDRSLPDAFVLDTTPPAAPGVNPVTTPTNNRNQIISGSKEVGASIFINGTQRVTADANTTWSFNYPLSEGTNTLTVTARDAAGNDSSWTDPKPVIVLDTTPPVFTVNPYQNPSSTATQNLTGTKEPGCIVKLNGTQIFGTNDTSATWSYTVSLISGITNHFVITAADDLGNTTTKPIDILYDSAPPAALGPGVLVADGSGRGTEVTLSWSAYPETSDVAFYAVYQSTSSFTDVSGMTPIGTMNKGTKTFKATGLTQGTTYYFAVVPVDRAGNQVNTVNDAWAVPTDTVAPEDVTNLTATAGYAATQGNFITISWTPSVNSTNDLVDQIVYVDSGTGYEAGTPLGKTVTIYTKTGLSDTTKYKFKITVKDALGHESLGSVVEAWTRLNNPVNLSAAPASGKVTLSWAPLSSPFASYVKEYRIYRKTSAVQQTDIATMNLIGTVAKTGTTYTDTGLVNDTTYQYAVTVMNNWGAERTDVQSISATPLADSTGPVIDTFNVIAGQVVTGPITITATAHDVESAMGSMEISIDGTAVATKSGGSISGFWNVVAATDGNHTVKVRALDSRGNATEDPRQVIVSLAPPAMPAITGHVVSQTTPTYLVNVSGTAPLFTTVTLKANGIVVGQAQTVGTTGTSGTFTFSSVALVEGDNVLAAKASHRGGESAFTPDYKILVDTGAPSAPQNLASQVLPGGLVRFSWITGAGEMPASYNLYVSSSTFSTRTSAGVSKANTNPITYQYNEYNPGDDSLKYYAVTAVDSAGNESGISNVVAVATDRTAPSILEIQYTQNSAVIAPNSAVGVGEVTVSFAVSEPLKELPFFSLEPAEGTPIVVSTARVDDAHYTGTFAITAQSPQGATTYKFSGKDMVGNRRNAEGTGISIDVKGPEAAVQAPVTTLQITPEPVTVNLVLNEPSVTAPALALKASDGTSAVVSSMTSGDNGVHWTGSLNVSGMPEGKAEFIMSNAQDNLGNIGTIVSTGRYILLYRDQVPSPGIPDGLAAKSEKAGAVTLTWYPVMYDPQNNIAGTQITYNIYRRAESESTPIKVKTGIAGSPAQDTPPDDGTYYYSVTAVGLMGSESPASAEVQAVSDRSGPPAPTNLTLSLGSDGVTASWNAVTDTLPLKGYHLYRSNATFTSSSGLTPVAKTPISTAVDTSPSKTYRFYAVAAVDSLGNEGPLSEVKDIDFPVSPVRSLALQRIDDAAPTITWQAPQDGTVSGYHIYRNGSRVTPYPVSNLSYADSYAVINTIYGVSAVDNLGNESPIKQVTLPDLTMGLRDGTTLRRGLLETLQLILTSGQGSGFTIDSLDVKVGTAPVSSILGPFSLGANTTLQIEKVAATTSDALSPVSVFIQANWTPSPGVTVNVSRTTAADVLGSSSSLEIFNDPLVRNTDAKIRLKVNNIGTAQMEIVTSENNTKTTKVKVMLKDQDGNMLSTGYLDQRIGSSIVNGAGYAVARINPNESFMTDPILLPVPVSAPYKVIIEAVIENTYYHYAKTDQVTAPGMKGTTESYIQETPYRATAVPEKTFYAMSQPVVINGSAISNDPSLNGQLVPNVPVKLGISVNGFDRFYTVTTDVSGKFSYTFTPGASEAGNYSLWAVHPDVKDRTVQATFSIAGIAINPTSGNLRMARNRTLDLPVTISNYGGGSLTGLTFETTSSSGITAGILNSGDSILNAGEKQAVTLRISADSSAPDAGWVTVKASVAEGLSVTLNASLTMVSLVPIITTSPSYIDTGMVRGDQKAASFTIKNTGEETLRNARIEGPSTAWISLVQNRTIGDILPGASTSVTFMLNPPSTLAQGVYDDQVVIYSDNHIPYTYHIQITVSSNAVGSVYFVVQNMLAEHIPDATITFQHQLLKDLIYTVKTGTDGTVMKSDIPEGRYSFNVSAPAGHLPYSGTFTVTPGLTTTASVILEVKLVDVTWSVVPTTIQDKYEIKITQTFATNVPLPVLVTEPPMINLLEMQPGQVFNGEFTVTNYGLIAVVDVKISFPTSYYDYDIEVFTSSIPTTIRAQQKITIPFKVTKRQTVTAGLSLNDAAVSACNSDDPLHMISPAISDLFNEVRGYGAGCVGPFPIGTSGTAETCPVSGATATASTSGYVAPPSSGCTSGGGGSGGGGGGGWGWGGWGSSGGQGTGAWPGQTSSLPTGNCECMDCDDHNECTTDSCSGGACLHEPVICPPSTDPCRENFCNPASGCDTRNKPDGTSCPDEPDMCTIDKCQGGSCSHPAKDCTDEYDCTIDSCDSLTGCKHEFLDEMPDDPTDCVNKMCGPDGVIVTEPDDGETPADPCYICKNGSPQAKDCDDHIDCSEDSCNQGACEHVFLDEMPDDPTDCVNKRCGPNGSVVIEADDGETPPQGPPDDCWKNVCENKASVPKPNPGETPPQTSEHDCRTQICKDDGSIGWVPNDGEVPLNECKMCQGGNEANKPNGPLSPDDPTDCVDKSCIDGVVQTVADNGEIPPQGPPDDCLKYVCENKVSVPKPNPSETPPQTSEHDCRTQICKDDGSIGWAPNDGEVPLNECKICQGGNEANKPNGPLSPDDPTDCVDKSCIDGVVQMVADDGETPPQGPSDDCLKNVCENKVSVPKPNPSETPRQASERDCRTDICKQDGSIGWTKNDGEQPLDECKMCKDGYEVNDPNATFEWGTLTPPVSYPMPDIFKNGVNTLISKIPGGSGISVKEAIFELSTQKRDCCATGSLMEDGEMQGTGTIKFKLAGKDVPIPGWGIPTQEQTFDFDLAIIDVKFEAGVYWNFEVALVGQAGKRDSLCDNNNNCYFGSLGLNSTLGLSAKFLALLCTDTIWTDPDCTGLEITPLAVSAGLGGSIDWNKNNCSDGTDINGYIGKVTVSGEFKVMGGIKVQLYQYVVTDGFQIF